MRKSLKIYLFILLLITTFGILGNILMQEDPRLHATDINADIPGSETMASLYERLAESFSEEAIFDIAVLPVAEQYDVEIVLLATATDEQTLLADTVKAIHSINEAAAIRELTIAWNVQHTTVMRTTLQPPFDVTTDTVAARATHYTYTPS